VPGRSKQILKKQTRISKFNPPQLIFLLPTKYAKHRVHADKHTHTHTPHE